MVTITISGPVLSGKSTIGVIIKRALLAHGIAIESSEEFSPSVAEELVRKLKFSNSHNLTAKIVQQQTKREIKNEM